MSLPRSSWKTFFRLMGLAYHKCNEKPCCAEAGQIPCTIQYCAKVTQANFDEFPGFSKKFPSKRNFRDFSVNFQGTYCFIPLELSNDNSQWTLTSQEISRESSLWWLRVLIQTKQNTATVRDLLLC